jgi:hypothetical protein
MSIQNGKLPIKVSAAAFLAAGPIAVAGVILTNAAAGVSSAVVQDGHNNDLVALNTTASSGVSGVMFPFPVVMDGLSVPALAGAGAVLYIYLADV